jgi:hypothetical protein
MKRQRKGFVFKKGLPTVICLYLLLPFITNCNARESEITALCKLDSGTPVKIPEYFLGVHHPVLFSINKNNKPIFDAEQEKMLRDINITALRGPGGTIGNNYLWRQGYLFTSKSKNHDVFFEKSRASIENRGSGNRPIYLRDIYNAPNTLGIPYIFAVNFMTQSPEEIKTQVQAMRKLTKQPIMLELGNELYEPNYIRAFPTCKDYIAKVRATAKLIKQVDPGIMIGVVCPAHPVPEKQYIRSALRELARQNNGPVKRYVNWADELSKNNDAFDAVIIHPYVRVTSKNFTKDTLMQYMYAWAQSSENVLKTDYSKLFPGKQIWITEFGILPWIMLREKELKMKNRLQFCKTPGTAIINMENVLRYIDAGNVTTTALHTFIDGQCFGLAQPWGKKYVKLPNYYVYKELGSLLKHNPYYYRINIDSGGKTNYKLKFRHVKQGPEEANVTYNNIGAWGLGTKNALQKVVFANRTAAPLKVSLKGIQLRTEWIYGGKDPLPEFLKYSRKWTAPPAVCPVPQTLEGNKFASVIELPPYSMTVAKVRRMN